MVVAGAKESLNTLVFVYGTLKRGLGNAWLMQELEQEDHVCFMGSASTEREYPLICGPFQVPFLLNFPCTGHRVQGEVYMVDNFALAKLDELEGVSKGHYERRPLVLHNNDDFFMADAYFAASGYAAKLLKAPHLTIYSTKEAARYVKRGDRPQGVTFLEHVQDFICSLDSTAHLL